MSKAFNVGEDKKEALKRVIRSLHEGKAPDEIKERFREIIEGITPKEIAEIEEELIKEGMPQEEIRRLCDVHLAVFREPLEKEKFSAPVGHPIHILMEEHNSILAFANDLKNATKAMTAARDPESVSGELMQASRILEHLKQSESHYLREENVLFPYLERHGVTQSPAIMWVEHDRIRETKKNLYSHIEARKSMSFQEFAKQFAETALALQDMLSSHFYKENSILFPTSLEVIQEGEWKEIQRQFDDLGYCSFTPESARARFGERRVSAPRIDAEGLIRLKPGVFSKEELEAILNTLPVDVTFVGKDDTVRYFNQSKERIFARTNAVIGRKVQQCHPQKSIHIVNRILEAFKNGSRDVADFWIDLKGRLVHIRYLAVRDENGRYLGCLEVTQDITNIKKIEGEKRLLDWT